jgi:hypothetical protein
MRVMIPGCRIQRYIRRIPDPLGRREVRIALTEVYAIAREISGAAREC